MKKGTFAEVKAQVASGLDKGRKKAEQEMTKMQKQVGTSLKKASQYMKQNPEKAALVAAGVGAALGAALALLVGKKKK